jgi:hypothetical protein
MAVATSLGGGRPGPTPPRFRLDSALLPRLSSAPVEASAPSRGGCLSRADNGAPPLRWPPLLVSPPWLSASVADAGNCSTGPGPPPGLRVGAPQRDPAPVPPEPVPPEPSPPGAPLRGAPLLAPLCGALSSPAPPSASSMYNPLGGDPPGYCPELSMCPPPYVRSCSAAALLLLLCCVCITAASDAELLEFPGPTPPFVECLPGPTWG